MAYMTIHRIDGDPEELLLTKQAKFDTVIDKIAPRYGAIASYTAKTDHGLCIVNVWRSPEDVRTFMQIPEVIEAQKESGLPMPSSFERFEDTMDTLYWLGPLNRQRRTRITDTELTKEAITTE